MSAPAQETLLAPVPPKPRVLVIEDDLSVVEGLVAGLSRAGFDVSVAMDGVDGANRAQHETFDVVLLDLMLPGRSGFDVLKAMSGRVSTPVIVLSARTELESRLKSFELGAIDFVPKPFWMEERRSIPAWQSSFFLHSNPFFPRVISAWH